MFLLVEYQVMEDESLCVILSTRGSVDGLKIQKKVCICGRDSREETLFLTVGRPPTTPLALPQVHDNSVYPSVGFRKPFQIQ